MSERLGRFRHLEAPRAERAVPAAPGPESPHVERFEGVERPAAGEPGPAPATGARLERFGPEPDPVIELVDTEGRLPFHRCARCGADSNVLATACARCGASLDTEEQRTFDERLLRAREAEAVREAAAAAERRALQERAAAEDARARRAMAEELARQVGDRERRRLDAEDRRLGIGGWSGRPGATPLGLLLLGLLRTRRSRLLAAIAGAALALGLTCAGVARTGPRGGGSLVAVALLAAIVLLSPRRRRW